jgi:hypothetical protein
MHSAVGLCLPRGVERAGLAIALARKRVLDAAAGARGSMQRRKKMTADAIAASRALASD